MKTFLEMTYTAYAEYIAKVLDDPNAQAAVRNALGTFLAGAHQEKGGEPDYINAVLILKELLPKLKANPQFRKQAEELEMLIGLDMQKHGIGGGQ